MPFLRDDDEQRPFVPFGVGDADHGGLGDIRVADSQILDVDRRDPLAAGLDDILGPIGDLQVALGVDDTDVADRPIRIFGGTADDYNPIARCKDFLARLHAAGRDVEITEYPNASHGFDSPLGNGPVVAKGGQTVRHCTIREEPVGLLIDAATKEPFTYKAACVETDPHVGADPEAREAAKLAVKNFLRATLKLE